MAKQEGARRVDGQSPAWEEESPLLRLTVGDIAALAGVHPSAVSRWRKRASQPFPAPVTGGRSPLFRASEVLPWLRSHAGLSDEAPPPSWYWQQTVRVLPAEAPTVPLEHLRPYLAALVTIGASVHGLIPQASTVRPAMPTTRGELRRLASTLEGQHPVLRGLLVPSLEEVQLDGPVLASLCVALDRSLGLGPSEDDSSGSPADLLDVALRLLADLAPGATATRPELADLIASFVGRWPGDRVLDPAVGEAELLARFGQQWGSSRALVGIEIDPMVARTGQLRLLLRGVQAEIHVADALQGDALADRQFEVVVADPPAGSKYGSARAWLEVVFGSLAPTGRAAVVVPAAALRANAAADHLLRERHVAAVVLLPATTRHGVRDTQAVAILTPGNHDRLVVLDLSDRRSLGAGPTDDVANLINRWLDDQRGADKAISTFTKRTGIAARLLANRDAQVAGVLHPTSSVVPLQLEATVLELRRLLDAHPGLVGSDRLKDALRLFAKKNHLPAE